jgi:hypothetical protein
LGLFCGATHSTFHVKKHPTYMSLTREDFLSFSLKIHINFISRQKIIKKLKSFSTLISLHPKNIP